MLSIKSWPIRIGRLATTLKNAQWSAARIFLGILITVREKMEFWALLRKKILKRRRRVPETEAAEAGAEAMKARLRPIIRLFNLTQARLKTTRLRRRLM